MDLKFIDDKEFWEAIDRLTTREIGTIVKSVKLMHKYKEDWDNCLKAARLT